MEKRDEDLIARYLEQDEDLKRYVTEHQEFERQLEEFNRRPYLTAEESIAKKKLQKLKLAGRDRIEQILARYRTKEVQP